MAATARDRGYAWPLYFDGLGPENVIMAEWRIRDLSVDVVIGPDGSVLATSYGFDGIKNVEEAVARAMREHPLGGDPKMLGDAGKSLAAAKAALASGDARAAVTLMAGMPDAARFNKAFAAESDALRRKLEPAGTAALAELGRMVDARHYGRAVAELKELSIALEGLPEGTRAEQRLAELKAMPDVQIAVADIHEDERTPGSLAHALASIYVALLRNAVRAAGNTPRGAEYRSNLAAVMGRLGRHAEATASSPSTRASRTEPLTSITGGSSLLPRIHTASGRQEMLSCQRQRPMGNEGKNEKGSR